VKEEAPEKRKVACARVGPAIAYSQHDRDRGLKDESKTTWSMEARPHLIDEPAREQVKLPGVGKLPDSERRCRDENDDYYPCKERAAGDGNLHSWNL
jgi:hypothetical protein